MFKHDLLFFTDDSLVGKLMEMIQNLSDKIDSMEEKLLQQGELYAFSINHFKIIFQSFTYVTFHLLESHITKNQLL